jgi:hypothetical protein
MFRATAQKALKSAASRLTPRGGGLATRRNMSGGGSIEEEIGKKKSRSHQNLFFPRQRYDLSLLSLMTTDICVPFCR